MTAIAMPLRAAVGLLVAIGAIAVVHWCVSREGQAQRVDRPPAQPAPPILPEAGLPRGVASRIVLVADPSQVPPEAAPVVRLGRAGAVTLVEAAPIPAGPVAEPWPMAVVILPRAALTALEPRERARLLDVLAAWGGTAGPGAGAVTLAGVRAQPGELSALLRWVR